MNSNIKHIVSPFLIIIGALAYAINCCSCKNNSHKYENKETKYPIVHHTTHGSETYLNDSIVVIRTKIKGLDNYETTIVNLRNTK